MHYDEPSKNFLLYRFVAWIGWIYMCARALVCDMNASYVSWCLSISPIVFISMVATTCPIILYGLCQLIGLSASWTVCSFLHLSSSVFYFLASPFHPPSSLNSREFDCKVASITLATVYYFPLIVFFYVLHRAIAIQDATINNFCFHNKCSSRVFGVGVHGFTIRLKHTPAIYISQSMLLFFCNRLLLSRSAAFTCHHFSC